MARLFVKSSGDRLNRNADTPISAYPFTLFAQIFPDTSTGDDTIMALGSDLLASNSGFLRMGVNSFGPFNMRVNLGNDVGGSATYDSTATFTEDAWNTASVSFESATDRRLYINGTKETHTANLAIASSLVYTAIGSTRRNSTPEDVVPFDGRIALPTIWNVTLPDAEHAMLAAGFSPLLVRPQSIVRHYPLIGRTSPEIELTGGFDLTVTGAVAADHPPVIHPVSQQAIFIPSAGGISDFRYRQRYFG